jgi:hypothetical protein
MAAEVSLGHRAMDRANKTQTNLTSLGSPAVRATVTAAQVTKIRAVCAHARQRFDFALCFTIKEVVLLKVSLAFLKAFFLV